MCSGVMSCFLGCGPSEGHARCREDALVLVPLVDVRWPVGPQVLGPGVAEVSPHTLFIGFRLQVNWKKINKTTRNNSRSSIVLSPGRTGSGVIYGKVAKFLSPNPRKNVRHGVTIRVDIFFNSFCDWHIF